MKVISKKIFLEDFKSRMPSIIPSFLNDELYTFNDDNILIYQLTNYNMLPCNVHVFNTDKLNFGKYGDKVYTFHEIVRIFHDFDNKINNVFGKSCAEKIELSVEEKNFYKWLIKNCFPFFFFENELSDTNLNFPDIVNYWGTTRLTIPEARDWCGKMLNYKKLCEIDKKKYCCECSDYIERGGELMLNKLKEWCDNFNKRTICDFNDYSETGYTYNVDDNLTKIKVKTLKQSNDGSYYVGEHSFDINMPIVKILGDNPYIEYGRIDKDGNLINGQNIEIVNNILSIPPFEINDSFLIYSKPNITIPISLSNNIENLGMFNEMVEDWDAGYDYNANFLDTYKFDYSGGNVVYYNGETWLLKNYEYPGYMFSTKYNEIYFANVNGMEDKEYLNYTDVNNTLQVKDDSGYVEQWVRYIDTFPKIEQKEIINYAYLNNDLILNPNPFIMGDKYKISTNNKMGYCLLKKTLYPIVKCEYIVFNNNKKYQVFYDYLNETQNIKINPYIFYFNKKYYIKDKFEISQTDSSTPMFIKNDCLEECDPENKIDGQVTIDDVTLYFKYDDKILKCVDLLNYVTVEEMKTSTNNTFDGYTTYSISDDDFLVIGKPYNVYRNDLISGETSSKLNELIDTTNMCSDDIGNVLNGLMPYKEIKLNDGKIIKSYVDRPSNNDWLGIPYIPSSTSSLELLDEGLYYGNFLKIVTINYIINPKKLNGLTLMGVLVNQNTYSIVCDTFDKLKLAEEFLTKALICIETITCDIEYYIGTILTKDTNETFKLYTKNNKFYGIRYIDNFEIINKQTNYQFDELEYCILNYWEMKPNSKTYINQDYSIIITDEPTSYFEYLIRPFEIKQGYLDYYFSDGIFYEVKNGATNVEIKNNELNISCPIYTENGVQKFSYKLIKENIVFLHEYDYFCEIYEKKYYLENVNGEMILNNGIDKYTYDNNNMLFVSENGNILNTDIYCEISIKTYFIHSKGTFDEYFDFTNNISCSPIFFKENNLGFASLENIETNIYIDRGTVRAIDYHLNLLDAKSLEALEQLGNGFFKINNNNVLKPN